MPSTAAREVPPLLLRDLAVEYRQREGVLRALTIDRLEIPPGTLCGISGPSGSGKTTLLHAAGGLLHPQAGEINWGEDDLARMGEAARDRWRRRMAGFVFQDFHLVPELTALDNVLLSVWFGSWSARRHTTRAAGLLREVGIPDPARRAGLLSRGEQQRVAIARALLHRPALILADEPTASLDAVTGAAVADLLVASARAVGATLLAVSHDAALLGRMDVVHRIDKGRLA
ncbi:Lipoprotein-releasing system ATP-binding protein LolD [Rhodovastum atsumiense]|uniref:ABC transporter ATP-binding protein n=1 Tax=Rhodovastum atsumiense TaxID=504468 RepID=A0A5M6IYD5_9PROT|nr:ABC transporter ATP-binding protein [Rhodovastum atsumiense]KAA5613291.1 ABC transporter ATP-binding protein [Rhodovastum atsumiense]CAH2600542.1 Lipoprotein-releasing system ATP-binding protein LolD [Rhodovastum atsumiense]